MPFGSPSGFPMADHLCGTYPLRIGKAEHHMRVIACEQHLAIVITVSIIVIYQLYLRPDRDSNAGPTA
jgi:hypothetical protein